VPLRKWLGRVPPVAAGSVVAVQQLPFPRHKLLMAKATCYQPVISRALIAALFHEAKRRRLPMTRLVDRLLWECLHGTPGWETAAHDWPELNSTLPQSAGESSGGETDPTRNPTHTPWQSNSSPITPSGWACPATAPTSSASPARPN